MPVFRIAGQHRRIFAGIFLFDFLCDFRSSKWAFASLVKKRFRIASDLGVCDSNRIAHRGCIARFGPLRTKNTMNVLRDPRQTSLCGGLLGTKPTQRRICFDSSQRLRFLLKNCIPIPILVCTNFRVSFRSRQLNFNTARHAPSRTELTMLPHEGSFAATLLLDGQNRQSPIASDFGSRTQIAALFAVLLYRNV